ncbi:MAG: DUF559 domain-containing protein [Pseudomonadota bacterium]
MEGNHGRPLSGHGFGRGQRPARKRGQGRNRDDCCGGGVSFIPSPRWGGLGWGDVGRRASSLKHHPPAGAVRRAQRLRNGATNAEQKLWRLLREAFQEHHFRRQVPIRHFIVDFASHPAKLVVEVDGGQHSSEMDAARTATIEGEGYRVIRFWNHEVLRNPDSVWMLIAAALREHHPTPTPPHQGEGN